MTRLLLRERRVLSESSFAEIVIWELPRRSRGSLHRFKYRLAFVVDAVCVLRFDNEAGKGDHKHISEREVDYTFTSLTPLLAGFGPKSIDGGQGEHGNDWHSLDRRDESQDGASLCRP